MKPAWSALVFAASLVTLVACAKDHKSSGQGSSAPPAATAAAAAAHVDTAAAQSIFNERCSACHGTEGRGNGPAAAALTPKPRNYTDAAWQASVTDEQIAKTITMGGAAVGKSPIMPASPDLDEKPEVVAGLVQIVRKFGR